MFGLVPNGGGIVQRMFNFKDRTLVVARQSRTILAYELAPPGAINDLCYLVSGEGFDMVKWNKIPFLK
jgi:hypothetical protein